MKGFVGSYLSGLDKGIPQISPEEYDKLSWVEQQKLFTHNWEYYHELTERTRCINSLILSGLGIGDIYGSVLNIEKELYDRFSKNAGIGLYD